MNMIKAVQGQAEKNHFECRECGLKMAVTYQTYNISYHVESKRKKFTILNAPVYKCDSCHNEIFSVLLYAGVESAVEKEIFIRLNNKQEIPDEMDFSELVTE
ncbi:hypothetical protein [Lentibacillus sediminis]|uniref:hypothetical protein n=1 Tax=Lentibacillus sediminis TaxID=1940529 RepID=UPI000C1C5998|nr:hypothetical protein [Lentibacillus sediminis]